jgi:hypothetical protein
MKRLSCPIGADERKRLDDAGRQRARQAMSWTETCGVCGSTRFWPSKRGYLVCYACCPDPLAALEILGRRVPGGVTLVQRWRQYLTSTGAYSDGDQPGGA